MRSRKSHLWKQQHGCSEADLQKIAQDLVRELQPQDRVLVEGPLGAGKSTWSQWVLSALEIQRPPEGSPSFPIAHEYPSVRWGDVIHIDFYRLRSEDEIFDAGIEEYFWNRKSLVLCEWISLWPDFEKAVLEKSPDSPNIWKVELAIEDLEHRSVKISRLQR